MSRQSFALVGCILVVLSAGCLGLGADDGSDDDLPSDEMPEDTDDAGEQPSEDADDLDEETPDDGSDDGDEDLPDAETLQDEIAENGFGFESFRGVFQIDVSFEGQELSGSYEVWERPAAELRVETIEPYIPGEADVHVSSGTETWWYSERTDRFTQQDVSGFIAFEGGIDLLEPLDGANVTVDGTKTVLDRDTYVLSYSEDPDDAVGDPESGTLYLDQETLYPLKQELAVDDETGGGVAVFEEATFDPELDDDLFEFEPPADGQPLDDIEEPTFDTIAAADNHVPFDVVEPEPPANITVDGVEVTETLTDTRLTIDYENETADTGGFVSPLSVVITDNPTEVFFGVEEETREVADQEVTVFAFEDDAVATTAQVVWESDGLEYTVGGTLSEAELVAVAESIIRSS